MNLKDRFLEIAVTRPISPGRHFFLRPPTPRSLARRCAALTVWFSHKVLCCRLTWALRGTRTPARREQHRCEGGVPGHRGKRDRAARDAGALPPRHGRCGAVSPRPVPAATTAPCREERHVFLAVTPRWRSAGQRGRRLPVARGCWCLCWGWSEEFWRKGSARVSGGGGWRCWGASPRRSAGPGCSR